MNNLNLFYETSSKYTKHNCQYWEQEISVKRPGKKRQSEANVPDLGGNDSPDASLSQVENEQPQANDRDHATKKKKEGGGWEMEKEEREKERANKQQILVRAAITLEMLENSNFQ